MRVLLVILLIIIGHNTFCQTFLSEYKEFKLNQFKNNNSLDSLRSRKEIKKIKENWEKGLEKQIEQFDTIFRSYKYKTGFDFNLSDSLESLAN